MAMSGFGCEEKISEAVVKWMDPPINKGPVPLLSLCLMTIRSLCLCLLMSTSLVPSTVLGNLEKRFTWD